MTKERQSNFELMRIVSMLFIITWHIILHGKIFDSFGEPIQFISDFILSTIIVHVNSLMFLTGYFEYEKKKISIKKVLKLLGTVWFYKSLIMILLLIFKVDTYDKTAIMEELLPLDFGHYWYINYYIVIYMVSPYLNKITEKLSEKEFNHFILLLIFLLSIIPTFTNGKVITNNGYSIMNLIIMYYIGSYFRKYPLKDNYHFKNISKSKLRIILIIIFILSLIFNISLYHLGLNMQNLNSEILSYFGNTLKGTHKYYSNPLIIIQTVAYCLLFETFNFKNKVVNFLAKSTFGIYIIHDNTYLKKYLYKWLGVTRKTTHYKVFLILLETILIIYFSCLIIEKMRRLLVIIIENIYKLIKNKSLHKEKNKIYN